MRRGARGYAPIWLVLVMACGGGDDAPGFADGTYRVTWGPHTAQPGEEGTKCVELRLRNPGPIRVHEIHNELGPSSHHFIVYRKAPGPELPTPTDCTPFIGTLDPANGAPLMITQKAAETLTLPAGVAFTLPEDQLIRLEMHYVNTTDAPIELQATAEFRTTQDATEEADFLFAGTPDINLPAFDPPQPDLVGPVYLPFPQSFAGSNVFAITGHTHKLGTDVEVAVAVDSGDPGRLVYQPTSFTWDEPETTFHRPAFTIPQGGGFRFACEYLNTTGQAVGFGEEANDEMCFFWLYYYPSKGAKVCFHTAYEGGHDVCCPADEGDGASAVICTLLANNGFPDF